MSMLADQIDRFVRWFFNVSPTSDLDRAPRHVPGERFATEQEGNRMPAPDLRPPRVRLSVIASAAMAALILLAIFYSVVAGAVDRAATQRHAAAQLDAAAQVAAVQRLAPPRAVLAVQAQPARTSQRYAPRTVAYVRSGN